MSVPNEDVSESAAVDVAALRGELEKSWVYEQLFVLVGFFGAGANPAVLGAGCQFAISIDGDITDVLGKVKNVLMHVHGA
jgi:hypothetical protein